ncbi:MAG: hypothetical protein OXJ36_06630 [bacterium]|nr:hypothetical protein [bacterium]MDE0438058.1 hypothetical protein [bacterium]
MLVGSGWWAAVSKRVGGGPMGSGKWSVIGRDVAQPAGYIEWAAYGLAASSVRVVGDEPHSSRGLPDLWGLCDSLGLVVDVVLDDLVADCDEPGLIFDRNTR